MAYKRLLAVECDTCEDGKGFYVRPCRECGKQKPLNDKFALVYGFPAGDLLPPLVVRAGMRERFAEMAAFISERPVMGASDFADTEYE